MTRPTTIPDVLDRAAKVVQTRGLCKGTLSVPAEVGSGPDWTPDAAVCTVGAIHVALTGEPTWPEWNESPLQPLASEAYLALAQYLKLSYRRGRVDLLVGDWNDAPERTQDEVVSTMRACAASLRGGETQ